jgi:hypothetical protein
MCTHPYHDEPFWSLDTVGVGLGVTQFRYIDASGFFDFIRGAVADEDRFAPPFDDDLEREDLC